MKNTILSPLEQQNDLTNKIYAFLINNALGYEKRVKSAMLMQEFNIKDNKTLRNYIEEIRCNDNYEKIICSESGNRGGYFVATNDEEVYLTLEHLYKRSMQMLKTYSKIRKKARLDGQYILKLNEYQKEIYESIVR